MKLVDILKKGKITNKLQDLPADEKSLELEPKKNARDEEAKISEAQEKREISEKSDLEPEILEIQKIYSASITTIRNVFQSIKSGCKVNFNKLLDGAKNLTETVFQSPDIILMFADRSTPDLYLYAHSVNVSIFSLILSNAMKFSTQDSHKVCICALLHDMGMIKVIDIAQKSDKLTPQEFIEIKTHPEQTVTLLDNFSDLTSDWKEFIKEVVLQIHERKSGKGYPLGLKDENINEISRLISISDTYEALTHPRNWRDRYLPHDALKMLIESAETDFDVELVKLFITNISLYPPGSYVMLNTDEIARVISVNKGLPTRPKVKAILDANYERILENKILDLSTNAMICITEPIDELKIKTPDKKLLLELKTHKWWIK